MMVMVMPSIRQSLTRPIMVDFFIIYRLAVMEEGMGGLSGLMDQYQRAAA